MRGQSGNRVSTAARASLLLAAGRILRMAGNGVAGALPADDVGAPYDCKRRSTTASWAPVPTTESCGAGASRSMRICVRGARRYAPDARRRRWERRVHCQRLPPGLAASGARQPLGRNAARASGSLEGAPAALVHTDLSDLPFAWMRVVSADTDKTPARDEQRSSRRRVAGACFLREAGARRARVEVGAARFAVVRG